ncbi:MAG: MBL fold metallo-hydrolase [Caldilineae bacterium]|nr:MAG: MBL fold metallo-hydrolase [Caldilineae bacterium]
MQQLFDGVYMLEGEVGGRPLQLVYLRGDSASILLDTGCARDPVQFIIPQMQEAGGTPTDLTWIINTHCDLDHTGGNHLMKQYAPQAILACGDADRPACMGPQALFQLRYDAYRGDHQIYYDEETRRWILDQSGQDQPIEATFVGGEHLLLGSDWVVEVVALPGHSHGHLGILDRKNRALYAGDAIHGRVYLGFDGKEKLPPTYLHVDEYLATIRLVEHLPIDTFVGCHWPVMRGEEIARFCAESRQFVEQAESMLLEYLAEPHTLREACLALGPRLGDWPHGPLDLELVFALNGHLQRLLQRGLIETGLHQEHPRILSYVRREA